MPSKCKNCNKESYVMYLRDTGFICPACEDEERQKDKWDKIQDRMKELYGDKEV